jgi:arylsulfatase A-like enzyme
MATLAEIGQEENTIVVFTADHGCHFRTRNAEYKRSCHDSSLRVPLVIWGPGLDRRQVVPEPVGLVDVPPTLLDAAGLPVPETMQGRSLLPLVRREAADWPEETFVQISESMTGRAIRSERWTYCVMAPDGQSAKDSDVYVESHLYDTFADPFQHVNLVGRDPYKEIAGQLRNRLLERMRRAGEPPAEVRPWAGNAPP